MNSGATAEFRGQSYNRLSKQHKEKHRHKTTRTHPSAPLTPSTSSTLLRNTITFSPCKPPSSVEVSSISKVAAFVPCLPPSLSQSHCLIPQSVMPCIVHSSHGNTHGIRKLLLQVSTTLLSPIIWKRGGRKDVLSLAILSPPTLILPLMSLAFMRLCFGATRLYTGDKAHSIPPEYTVHEPLPLSEPSQWLHSSELQSS